MSIDKSLQVLALHALLQWFIRAIADIAIHPEDDNIWYVAVGSGGAALFAGEAAAAHLLEVGGLGQDEELVDGEEIEVEIVDLSLKGALLRPSRPIELGEDAAGVLKLALSPEVTIVMAVSVAHQGAGRIGLDCTHIDIESAQHLRRLVELAPGILRLVLAAALVAG